MEEFKMCSDGEFMPVSLPCPPPYAGPYYYYPYENIPFPPADGASDSSSSGGGGGGGAPISAGVVAGIIILVSFFFVMMCVFAVKCRSRSLTFGNIMRSLTRNAGNTAEQAGEFILNGAGHDQMLVSIAAGGGLEEKLVSLLPVFEYVGLQEAAGKVLQEEKVESIRSSTECAVCLSSFAEKDFVRVLPKCHHTFHLHCIDTWFQSHANCPLCRERITLQTIQLYFKAPHPQPAGPCNYPCDHHTPEPCPDPNTHQPAARPGCDHPVHDQQPARLPAGTLISCANTATVIEDHDQDPAKYQSDQQPARLACDQHVNDEQATGLACGRLAQGLDNLLEPAVSTAATLDDHHQIDVHPAEPCRYQHACGHLHVNDQLQDAGEQYRGGLDDQGLIYDAQNVTPAAAHSDDQLSVDDHHGTAGESDYHQLRICSNPSCSLNEGAHEDNCSLHVDIHHSGDH